MIIVFKRFYVRKIFPVLGLQLYSVSFLGPCTCLSLTLHWVYYHSKLVSVQMTYKCLLTPKMLQVILGIQGYNRCVQLNGVNHCHGSNIWIISSVPYSAIVLFCNFAKYSETWFNKLQYNLLSSQYHILHLLSASTHVPVL